MPNLRILFQSYKKVVVFLFFAEKDISQSPMMIYQSPMRGCLMMSM